MCGEVTCNIDESSWIDGNGDHDESFSQHGHDDWPPPVPGITSGTRGLISRMSFTCVRKLRLAIQT
jgi:hypothetical protein